MVKTFTETKELLRLGVPRGCILAVASYSMKNEESCYWQGFEHGKATDSEKLVGHRQIAKYLGCSVRKSERVISEMRKMHVLPLGTRGVPVVVRKQILDEFLDTLAVHGGSAA